MSRLLLGQEPRHTRVIAELEVVRPAYFHALHLYETHLPVRSTDASSVFYQDIVGLELAYHDPSRDIVFLWVGSERRSMLGLWGPDTAYGRQPSKRHLAFAVTLPKLLAAGPRLHAHGVATSNFHGEETTEPSVLGWMPSAQLYFQDPDGHALEYIALLDGVPDAAFIGPLSTWQHKAQPGARANASGPRAFTFCYAFTGPESSLSLHSLASIMNTVFVGVHGNVLALEKLSGALLWQTYLDGGFGESFVSLATDGDFVFAHTRGKLFCLEASSGRILWMNDLPGMGYGIASICALAGTPESPAALKVQQKTSAGS